MMEISATAITGARPPAPPSVGVSTDTVSSPSIGVTATTDMVPEANHSLSNVQEFVCDFQDCGRRFLRKTSLTNHRKAHNNFKSRSIKKGKLRELKFNQVRADGVISCFAPTSVLPITTAMQPPDPSASHPEVFCASTSSLAMEVGGALSVLVEPSHFNNPRRRPVRACVRRSLALTRLVNVLSPHLANPTTIPLGNVVNTSATTTTGACIPASPSVGDFTDTVASPTIGFTATTTMARAASAKPSASNIKEFVCDLHDCGRRFLRKTSFTNHRKAHNNVKSRSINKGKGRKPKSNEVPTAGVNSCLAPTSVLPITTAMPPPDPPASHPEAFYASTSSLANAVGGAPSVLVGPPHFNISGRRPVRASLRRLPALTHSFQILSPLLANQTTTPVGNDVNTSATTTTCACVPAPPVLVGVSADTVDVPSGITARTVKARAAVVTPSASNVREFVCDFQDCDRRFLRKTSLTNHRKAHVHSKFRSINKNRCRKPKSNEVPIAGVNSCLAPGSVQPITTAMPPAVPSASHPEAFCASTSSLAVTVGGFPSVLVAPSHFNNTSRRPVRARNRRSPVFTEFICDFQNCGRRFLRKTSLTNHRKAHEHIKFRLMNKSKRPKPKSNDVDANSCTAPTSVLPVTTAAQPPDLSASHPEAFCPSTSSLVKAAGGAPSVLFAQSHCNNPRRRLGRASMRRLPALTPSVNVPSPPFANPATIRLGNVVNTSATTTTGVGVPAPPVLVCGPTDMVVVPSGVTATMTKSRTAAAKPSASSVQEFVCDFQDCGRRFLRKTSLTNHRKAHNNIKSRSINKGKGRKPKSNEVPTAGVNRCLGPGSVEPITTAMPPADPSASHSEAFYPST